MSQPAGDFKAGVKILTAKAASGTTTAGAELVIIDVIGAFAYVAIQLTGISGDTVTWEGTVDGTTWVAIRLTNLTSGTAASTATANGIYAGDVRGLLKLRANVTVYSAGVITALCNLTAF